MRLPCDFARVDASHCPALCVCHHAHTRIVHLLLLSAALSAAGAKASAALDKARSELAESLGAADRIKKEYADNETEAGGVLNCMAAAESAASAAHVALAEASAAADAAEKSAKTTRDAVAELKAAVDEAEAGVAVSA